MNSANQAISKPTLTTHPRDDGGRVKRPFSVWMISIGSCVMCARNDMILCNDHLLLKCAVRPVLERFTYFYCLFEVELERSWITSIHKWKTRLDRLFLFFASMVPRLGASSITSSHRDMPSAFRCTCCQFFAFSAVLDARLMPSDWCIRSTTPTFQGNS